MLPVDIYFVAVPGETWSSWPPERALMHLANDAIGIERRIRKGVDVVRERVRYRMLSESIESLALEAFRSKRARAWLLSSKGYEGKGPTSSL